jgi:hypothetical protein
LPAGASGRTISPNNLGDDQGIGGTGTPSASKYLTGPKRCGRRVSSSAEVMTDRRSRPADCVP